MRELPKISEYISNFGIKPERRGFSDSYTIIGLDTETVGNNDITVDKDLYSIQVVKNSLNEEYFYLISKDDIGIGLLDEKTETGNYIFNRYSFISAHNLEFDLGAMLGEDFLKIINYHKYKENNITVKEGNVCYKGWKIKFSLGQSSFFQFRKNKTKLVFTDSRNWFKGKLEDIGKTFFNMKKHDKPAFIGMRPPKNDIEFNQFREYAMQDARIQFLITKKISDMHRDDDISYCITPASFTAKTFKKGFLTNRLFLERNIEYLKLIWSCYHGARFESIGRGYFEKMNMYDVNSLYPYSMKMSPLNFSNTRMQNITLNDVEHGFIGFCRVEFEFPNDVFYPCLPVRENKLVFPLKGVSYCTTHEILTALKLNVNIIDFKAIGWQPKEQDINHPLSKFVDFKYNEKLCVAKQISELEQENNDFNTEEIMKLQIEYYKIKLQLNSLYGKFAQRNDVYDLESNKNIEIAGAMFKPDFAALITGYSRKVIHEYMSNNESVYCDTDSIITKNKIDNNFELGGLKKEYEDIDFCIIRSKLYFGLENDKVIKAAKHGFRIKKEDAYALLKKYNNETAIPYSCERMTKSLESLKSVRMSHSKPRKWVTDSFNITLTDDGKRVFDKKLETPDNLLNDKTMSLPLQYAESVY